MSAALDFQGDPAMTKAQSKLFVLQPVRRSGRARPPLLPALKKSTTRLREAATRDKGSSQEEKPYDVLKGLADAPLLVANSQLSIKDGAFEHGFAMILLGPSIGWRP
jgi:hypothetical protein